MPHLIKPGLGGQTHAVVFFAHRPDLIDGRAQLARLGVARLPPATGALALADEEGGGRSDVNGLFSRVFNFGNDRFK